MIVSVRKIWMGHVSVRDYIVKKAIAKKEDLVVRLMTGERKVYPYKSLVTYLANTTKTEFKSVFTGKKYYLIDFPWKPIPSNSSD
jgi:hypothetical protein